MIVLAVLVVLFVVVVATRPADFRVTRSGRVSAPAEVVFANVNNFHKWEEWSPWAKLDPQSKTAFSGPESGPGASMTWNGNSKVGEGRMTILDAQPPDVIHIKIEFFRPFKSTNSVEFLFRAEGKDTTVTWSMSGKNNFFTKAFGMFVNCDTMVGRDFEKGLVNLNTAVQASTPG